LSKSQINRLGDRLRKDRPLPADVETLDMFRRSFDEALQIVVQKMRALGLEPSVRIKTTISTVEKLKRESIRLSRLQDVAGCRVIVDDLADQDRVVGLIIGAFPKAVVIDRRGKPSHGYRAVYVVIDIDDRLVEVQIRTELQHLWAVLSETWADALDQSIKYGGGPPEIHQNLKLKSEIVALIEIGQQRLLQEMDKGIQRESTIRDLHERLTKDELPAEAFERAGLSRNLKDLIRRERKMKDRFTHDVMELDLKERNS